MKKSLVEKIQIGSRDDYYTRERFTKAEIQEYTEYVICEYENVLRTRECEIKSKFGENEVNSLNYNLKKLKSCLVIEYPRQRTNTYGCMYCDPHAETFGKMELNVGYVRSYLSTVVVNEILNTIVHEIGHAVAGYVHGHDYLWKLIGNYCLNRIRSAGLYFGAHDITRCSDAGLYGALLAPKALYTAVVCDPYGGFEMRYIKAIENGIDEDEVECRLYNKFENDGGTVFSLDKNSGKYFDYTVYNKYVDMIIKYKKEMGEYENDLM